MLAEMKKRTICWKDMGEFTELKEELTKREGISRG